MSYTTRPFVFKFSIIDPGRPARVIESRVKPSHDLADRIDRALAWMKGRADRFVYLHGPNLAEIAVNESSVSDIKRRLGLPVTTAQPPAPAPLPVRQPEDIHAEAPRRSSKSGKLIGLAWVRMNDEYRLLKLFETSPGKAPEMIKVRHADESKAWRYIRAGCPWPHCGIWIGDSIGGYPGLVWGPIAAGDMTPIGKARPNLEPFRLALGPLLHNEAVRFTPKETGEMSPQFSHADRAYPHIRSTRSAQKFRAIRAQYWIPDYILLDYIPMSIIEKCCDLRRCTPLPEQEATDVSV